MDNPFLYALIFPVVLYILLRAVEYWILPKLKLPEGSLEVRERELERQIESLREKNRELETNQDLLLKELGKANAKIQIQENRIRELESEIVALKKSAPITPVETKPLQGRVLGVWPEAPELDLAKERKAVSNSGLEYEALEGKSATRMGIIEQLGQRDYKIMEIGARGGERGIKLADGIASPEWWTRLAKQHNIDIFVVLANESSKPGVVNVADALYSAGAKAVVSVDSKISDTDAVHFATMLYRRLGRGVPLAKAVEYARLVISDGGSDTIKLRERT